MGAIDDINTALLAKTATITDALDKAEAEAYVAEYVAIKAAILSLSGSATAIYSIAGRSVTRADLPSLREQAASIKAQIALYADGDNPRLVAVGDCSGAST